MKKQETKQIQPASVKHKVLSIVGIILCVLLLPILIINITLIVRSYTNPDKVVSLGTVVPLIVLTDSMNPEIKSGDMIICKTAEEDQIAVGDIIAFYDPSSKGSAVVTHRVIEITEKNGELAWRTQGDANNTADTAAVPASKLVGVFRFRIPFAGNIAMFMQTTQGLILCVVLPILLLVGYDMFRRKQYEKKQKLETEALLAEKEALLAQATANAAAAAAATETKPAGDSDPAAEETSVDSAEEQ